MAITLRSVKGSALTHAEMDTNFTDLRDIAAQTSGNLNGVIIGATTRAAVSGTSGNFSTTLAVTGVATLSSNATVGGTLGVTGVITGSSLTASMAVVTNTSKGLISVDSYNSPNLLINPNWQIDQINEGALYTINGIAQVGPDGWSGTAIGAGVFKLRTLADPDNVALRCLEITCTTADASIAAADVYEFKTAIEGYDAAGLMTGTSSAQAITIQFKFKTSVTGVYGVAIQNSAQDRRYISTITVADTSENEYSVTLTMDTSGTWLYTNGVGLWMFLTLSAGSNYQSTAGAWAASSARTTSAQCNFMSSTANIAYLKRIQLIPGSVVQAYKPADIQKELAKCQKYYWKSFNQGTAVAQSAGNVGALMYTCNRSGASADSIYKSYPVTLRATPTITFYNPGAANALWRNLSNAADSGAASNAGGQSGMDGITVSNAQAAGDTATNVINIHATANARLS